jgi:LCP family protein required for cell wall assembly
LHILILRGTIAAHVTQIDDRALRGNMTSQSQPAGKPAFFAFMLALPDRLLARYRSSGRRQRGCLLALLVLFACFSLLLVSNFLVPPRSLNIVILGVDARPGQGYLTRTDTVMLLNITPGRLRVSLLSIPRDVFIYVPEYGEQRINTINVLGEEEAHGAGPALVKASFKESFGVTVNNYVRLDFNGFVDLIDAVGGIDVNVPKLIIDYDYPTSDAGTMTVRFDPGWQHMDGERALEYARTRHQDGDYQRAERQQQVVDALIKKLADPRQIIHWPRIWKAIRSNMDSDLSTWEMVRLGPALLLGWPGRDHRVLQREDLIGMKAGYWRPNYDQLLPWIKDHFG